MGNNNNEVSYSGTVNHYESKHVVNRNNTQSKSVPKPKAATKPRPQPRANPIRGKLTRAKQNIGNVMNRLKK